MLEYVDPSERRGVMLDVQLQAVSCKSLRRITIPVVVCIRRRAYVLACAYGKPHSFINRCGRMCRRQSARYVIPKLPNLLFFFKPQPKFPVPCPIR